MAQSRHHNGLEAVPHREFSAEEKASVKDLRRRIEALCDTVPGHSMYACTPRKTPHLTILNGPVKGEHERSHRIETVEEAIEGSFLTAKALREQIDGPAMLWWRAEPELDWGYHDPDAFLENPPEIPTCPTWHISLRMRLCFEAP
jgi:hypothetical protein